VHESIIGHSKAVLKKQLVEAMAQQGRLKSPDMTLLTDPRTHPAIHPLLQAMIAKASAVPGAPRPSPVPSPSAPLDELFKWIESRYHLSENMISNLPIELPTDASLPEPSYKLCECPGPDGNAIKLHVYRPPTSVASSEPLPCVAYIHGGAMEGVTRVSIRLMKDLAQAGFVAIAIDFRNIWTPEGWNHYPKGLNDCAAAVQWIKAHQKELNISKIIVFGESGGGNLTIATTLKAKQEGWIDAIDGAYVSVPYISGAYGWDEEKKLKELPSLVECDRYFVDCSGLSALVRAYDPEGKNATNPLAWPYWSEEKDLKGLPPFVISVNELDPLRDEGIVFWRKLVKAGVKAVGRTNLGLFHGAEHVVRGLIPDASKAYIGSIKSFAESL
jgi:acetyl esterase